MSETRVVVSELEPDEIVNRLHDLATPLDDEDDVLPQKRPAPEELPARELYSQIIAREASSLDMTPEEYVEYTWVGMGVDTWIAYGMADKGVIIDDFGNWTYDPVKKILYHKDPREKDVDLRVIQSAGDIFMVIEETYSFFPTVESEEFLDFYRAMQFAVDHTFAVTLGDLRGSQLTWTSDTMSEEK